MTCSRSELLVYGYIFNEEQKLKCLLPNEIYNIIFMFYPDSYVLLVNIHQLDKLIIMDKLCRSSDPYILVQFNGLQNKTSIFKHKLSVKVNETITFPVKEPIDSLSNNYEINIKVMDWDIGGISNHSIIGTVRLKFENIREYGLFYRYHWIHMYGAPNTYKNNQIIDKMNKSIIEGTRFRGSILLSMRYEPKHNAKREIYKISWNKSDVPKITEWILQIDVYKAIGINTDYNGKRLLLKMMIRDNYSKTEFITTQNGECEWYEIMNLSNDDEKEETIHLRMPLDINQCPDIIFYLIKKDRYHSFTRLDEIISYKRFSWKELVNLGFVTPPKWYTFKSSEVFTKQSMEEDKWTTSVLLGIRAGLKQNKPTNDIMSIIRPYTSNVSDTICIDEKEEINKQTVNNNDEQSEIMGKLQITVINAENVPIHDGGTTDQYVDVRVYGLTQKTSVQKNTLQPTWNETFTFNGISINDSISLQLNDWNRFGKKNKIGKIDNIILIDLLQKNNGKIGIDFNYTEKYFISQKFTNCTLTISISFHFDKSQCRKRCGLFDQYESISSKNKCRVSLFGKPISKKYKISVYIHKIELINTLLSDVNNEYIFEISHCSKSIRNRFNIKEASQEFNLNVDVAEPIKYAPNIRCSLYERRNDIFNTFDLIGRFYVSISHVFSMMNGSVEGIWYNLYSQKEEDGDNKIINGRMYISIQMLTENAMDFMNKSEENVKLERSPFIEREIEILSMNKAIKYVVKRCENQVLNELFHQTDSKQIEIRYHDNNKIEKH